MSVIPKGKSIQKFYTQIGSRRTRRETIQAARVLVMAAAIAILPFSFAGAPVSASTNPDLIRPGRYYGTIRFTLSNIWSLTSAFYPVNDYSMIIEGVGSIQFTIRNDLKYQSISLHLPGFTYIASGHTVINLEDSPCKGHTEYGGGEGRMQAPASLVSDKIVSLPVTLIPGEPWGEVYPNGNCEDVTTTQKWKEAMKWGITGMTPRPWEFTITDQRFGRLAGTCTSDIWHTPAHNMECTWQAFRVH